MARPSAAARNLSLTEELERLEQSITLTLQEIDHNFSKAHRIVTTSILPIVEQYGEHSRAVWDASKFWKQFFEASANVSLSGYEELNNEDDSTVLDESTIVRDEPDVETTEREHGADETARAPSHDDDSLTEELTLAGADLTGSTPRRAAPKSLRADMSKMESPYEAMRREMISEEEGHTTVLEDDYNSSVVFAQQTARLPDMSMTPQALIKERNRADQSAQKSKDPLLHRVLDKNYRLQATPHKTTMRNTPVESNIGEKAGQPSWHDSPMSSPEIAVPTLRSDVYMSPLKGNQSRQRFAAASQGPRTPGVSVQTPVAAKRIRDALAANTADEIVSDNKQGRYEIDWDSDDDDDADLYGGMSPPKTIQFALPPSKLLQTPAKEASRQIVGSILANAGADPDSSEFSPSLVKMNKPLDDSF